MSAANLRYLVGVAGPPGAGKTALVQGLSAAMHDSTAIHMDSYEQMTRATPEHVQRWLQDGADIDEFEMPRLPEDLALLRSGTPVSEPGTGAEIPPRKYILFETQFGRAHRATGSGIDLLIWVDTPLDVALARNLLAFTATFLREPRSQVLEERMHWLHDYIDQYLRMVRPLMVLQRDRVAAGADLVVDGLLPIPELIEQTKQEILRRLP